MRIIGLLAWLVLLSAAVPISAMAQRRPVSDPDRVLRQIGAEAIREIATDICFPATGEEYAALGKNAILMLRSSSAISTELPLRSVYVVHRGVRIPLHRIALLEKREDEAASRTIQVSFYLLPIHFMKVDSQVLADFDGERTGFGILHFSARNGLDRDAPAFARLDEYDTPTDPDPAMINRVLAREYPEYFP